MSLTVHRDQVGQAVSVPVEHGGLLSPPESFIGLEGVGCLAERQFERALALLRRILVSVDFDLPSRAEDGGLLSSLVSEPEQAVHLTPDDEVRQAVAVPVLVDRGGVPRITVPVIPAEHPVSPDPDLFPL